MKKEYLISSEQEKYELELFFKDIWPITIDFVTLWTMFRAVVENSSWGTSESGGPVWVMDFTVKNLKKIFPDSLFLSMLENEFDAEGNSDSNIVCLFSKWFSLRAYWLITRLGLGNVLVKLDNDGYAHPRPYRPYRIHFYGYGIFLDVLERFYYVSVNRPSDRAFKGVDFPEHCYSVPEALKVKEGNFLTYGILYGGDLYPSYDVLPVRGGRSNIMLEHPEYGTCMLFQHISMAKNWVIRNKSAEEFLILVIQDFMEAKAQGYGKGYGGKTMLYPAETPVGYLGSVYDDPYPYPLLKYNEYLDENFPPNSHFQKTKDEMRWSHKRLDGACEIIKVKIPTIDPKHGEWWHRQFPSKIKWDTLDENWVRKHFDNCK